MYLCDCAPGFTGIQNCSTNVDECASTPCVHVTWDGVATPTGECIDLVDSYACNCDSGWNGTNCNIQEDPCSFEEDDCSDSSTCIHTGPGDHTCRCFEGFATSDRGRTCTPIDECASSPCQNAGLCYDRVDYYDCACHVGFSGDNCENDVDECAVYPCDNGAVCTQGSNSYACACNLGYSGVNCLDDVDECAVQPCTNGAVCLESSATAAQLTDAGS
jgi:hypothetical protein